MDNNYIIPFISQSDFEKHVAKTIASYNETLKSVDLSKFNSNIIDPIKLTFDRALFKKSIEEIIELEIHRQRDKSNTNAIGYFHQYMFKYISNCEVPQHGFDVIVTQSDGTKIYVEMKNKHNTMNSSSSQKTYIGMQNQILNLSKFFHGSFASAKHKLKPGTDLLSVPGCFHCSKIYAACSERSFSAAASLTHRQRISAAFSRSSIDG